VLNGGMIFLLFLDQRTANPFFVPGLILALIVVFFLMLKRNSRLASSRLLELNAFLPGKIKEGMARVSLETAWEGRDFTLNLSPGNKEREYILEITSPQAFPISLMIAPYDEEFDLEKETGSPSLKTGDEEFDRKFVVLGKQDQPFQFFLTPEKRQLISRMEFSSLEISPKGLSYIKAPLEEQDLWQDRVTALLTNLKTLCD